MSVTVLLGDSLEEHLRDGVSLGASGTQALPGSGLPDAVTA